MKSRIIQLFLFLVLVVGAGSVAQASAPYRVNVPFDFTVNGKLMKAGNYKIHFGLSSSDVGSFMLRSEDGKNAVMVTPTSSKQYLKAVSEVTAIFEKNGDNYSLSEISSPRVIVELGKRSSVSVTRVEVHSVK